MHDSEGNVIVDPERDMKSPEQGAATAIWCATSTQLDGMGGVYGENCDIALMAPEDSTGRGGVNRWAVDTDLAERLWSMSETMTGSELGLR